MCNLQDNKIHLKQRVTITQKLPQSETLANSKALG